MRVTVLVLSLLLSSCVAQLNETGFGVNTLEMLMPPSTAPSESAAPTSPTVSPTDSPVPSPSPSLAPSPSPTGTPSPTKTPSASPTDSPVPSPSPTMMPSWAPSSSPSRSPSAAPSASPSASPSSLPSSSPSSFPSSSPSKSPSAQPSVSAAPSTTPSASPSSQPSASPSASPSSAPSVSSSPSAMPSISSAPTTLPSLVPSSAPSPASIEMSALVSVNLENLMTGMTADMKELFEDQTKEFIQLELPPPSEMGVDVDILSVSVLEQTIVTERQVKKANSTRRFLQEMGLRVRMNVTGEVSPGGPPDDFDFAQVVSMGFATNYLAYAYRLSSADPFFSALHSDGSLARSDGSAAAGTTEDGDSSGGRTAGIVLGCLTALAMSVFVAFYAFKLRGRRSTPQHPTVATASIGSDDLALDPAASREVSLMSPKSPNTMESGRPLGIVRQDSVADSLASTPVSVQSNQSERILGIRAQPMSPIDANSMPVVTTSKHSNTHATQAGTYGDEASLDDKLRKDVMMSVGNAKSDPDPFNNVILSVGNTKSDRDPPMDDQSAGFTDIAAKTNACCGVGIGDMGGLLGARGMDEGERAQYKERKSDEAPPVMKRSGLYHVLAPPGPLGIVVDTTKDGPVVHSLKYTSALLGLVGSGDLIVGLDDIDTRSMTAATLTRLMAKRSNESERKITLQPVDR